MGLGCSRQFSWWGCCKFQPRYDIEPMVPAGLSGSKFTGSAATEIIELMVKRTYVRDVCIRCGLTIERQHP